MRTRAARAARASHRIRATDRREKSRGRRIEEAARRHERRIEEAARRHESSIGWTTVEAVARNREITEWESSRNRISQEAATSCEDYPSASQDPNKVSKQEMGSRSLISASLTSARGTQRSASTAWRDQRSWTGTIWRISNRHRPWNHLLWRSKS